ncbi:MAG: hydroxymethylglutaryl-CoA lyase [Crocinitomicaceae bacterium]|nr:hydroxymethylglutaryl-CoA lyase [Crocinitomicaceae bacterium]
MKAAQLQITECPRDAMQGIKDWIPTEQKARYLNALLQCGFDVLDFGSFVSPKAIPQMQDTAAVLDLLAESSTKLLAIIANSRGASAAAQHERISILGYPFSISETFQLRNTNSNLDQALFQLAEIDTVCSQQKKDLRIYLSMGFGNPYGDTWSTDLVAQWVEKLNQRFDISEFALSDTIGCATPQTTQTLFNTLTTQYPDLRFAAHLHVVRGKEQALIEAVIAGGCQHFDTAIGGFGGCPMAKDELTGNLATEALLHLAQAAKLHHAIDSNAFEAARQISTSIFNK